MKKKFFSYVLIWTIFLASTSVNGVFAQSVSKEAKKETDFQKVESIFSDKTKNNLKSWNRPLTKFFDTSIDLDKLNKDINKEAVKPLPKQKMSKKQKTFWILFGVGMAALIFVAIKYYKECEIYESYCQPDEICPCLKYKEETK